MVTAICRFFCGVFAKPHPFSVPFNFLCAPISRYLLVRFCMAVEGVDAMIAVWTLQTSGTARSDNIYFDFTQDEETARTFMPHDDVA